MSSDPDGRIVIAYDGSAAARQAVIETAHLLNSHRTLVATVWEEGVAFVGESFALGGLVPAIDPTTILDLEHDFERQAERVAHHGSQLAQSLGLDAKPIAVAADGSVADSILAVARDHQAVAIVVGSHGSGGLLARLEGSASQGVVKHAYCPVLVVHEPVSPDG
jgi:nucleotide-binding universal stress UspA family protein